MRGFKKAIKYAAAIATAGAMVGAGILAGMAYNLGDLPKPFVNDKGEFDAYVVVGENAATADVVGAITVGAAFAQKAVTQVPVQGASGFVDVTGGVALYDMDNKLELGMNMNEQVTSVGVGDLPFLVSGTIGDKTYKEMISFGDGTIGFANLTDVGNTFYVNTTTGAYTSVVYFNGLDLTKAVGEEINLFGKKMVFGEGSNITNIILYGGTTETTVGAGENTTIQVGDKTVNLKVVGINSNKNSVTFILNGEQYTMNASDPIKEKDGIWFKVKEVYAYDIPSPNGGAKFFFGADKLVLDNSTNTVSINDEDVNNTKVIIDGSGNTIQKISFEVNTTDVLKMGDTFVDPLFGFKLSFLGMDPTEDSSAREIIKVSLEEKDDKDTMSVSFVPKHYESEVKIDLINNESNYLFKLPGQKAEKGDLIYIDKNKIYKVDSIASNSVELINVFSGEKSTYDVINNHIIIDGILYPVNTSDGVKIGSSDFLYNITNTQDLDHTGIYYSPVEFETKYGATLHMDALVNATAPISLSVSKVTVWCPDPTVNKTTFQENSSNVFEGNLTCGDVTFTFKDVDTNANSIKLVLKSTFAEEDKLYLVEENDEYMEFGISSGKIGVNYNDTNNVFGGDHENVTVWGSIVKWNDDETEYTVSYPNYQTYYIIGFGDNPQMTAAGSAVSEKVNPIDVNMAQLDTAMGTVDKPVILVGGPAVNKLVAQLADANKTMSLDDWRSGDMNDKAIIQYVEDAFGDNPALIIAGYSAKDTVLASKVVAAQVLNGQYASEFKDKAKVTIHSESGELSDVTFE